LAAALPVRLGPDLGSAAKGTQMFEVSVDETFAAGHALRGYRGKCENVHGHNYKVRVTLAGEKLDSIGLLFDFRNVKLLINELVDQFDHKFLNDLEPFRDKNPSAENMVKYFYDEIKSRLEAKTKGRVRIKSVRLWETDTTSATYFE
jgi:6-pyruvoyltetrahydropterin/6-carboxytetrahydropterin synthase